MLDIADLIFEEAAAPEQAPTPYESSAPASPLRPWGMWGGWTALGLACAGAVASAVTRVGRSVVPDRAA